MSFYKQILSTGKFTKEKVESKKYLELISNLFEEEEPKKEILGYNLNLVVENDVIYGILSNDNEAVTFNIIFDKSDLEVVLTNAKKNNANETIIETYKNIVNFPVLIQSSESINEDSNEFILEFADFVFGE